MLDPRPTILITCAALLLAGAGPVRSSATAPVSLGSNPGTRTEETARQLVRDDIAAARLRGNDPLLLTGRAELGGAQPALLVQLQSPQECGSAGCTTSVYSFENGQWRRVLDSATGKLTISTKKTRGRNDVLSENDHYVWTGTAYRSLKPAPKLELQPGRRQR